MFHKGRHIFVDFTNFKNDSLTDKEKGEAVLKIMRDAVLNNSNMHIVHEHLEILGDRSEPGFTSVLLLDESHFTAHSYTSEKYNLLALDLFTCGETNTDIIMEDVIIKLSNLFKGLDVKNYSIHKRFKYNI